MDSSLSSLSSSLSSSFSSSLSSFSSSLYSSFSLSVVGRVMGLAVGSWCCLYLFHFVLLWFVSRFEKETKKGKKDEYVSVDHQLHSYTSGFFNGNGPIPLSSTSSIFFGYLMLFVLVPIVGLIIGLTVLWDFIDRVGQGRPQDGVVMSIARFINRVTAPLTGKLMRNKEDGFIFNVTLLLGVIIPILFFLSLCHTIQNGFSLSLCLFYHVVRLGPYFMNFAYCYTLSHKEGHSPLGFYSNSVVNSLLSNSFNWWIGLFYGVIPSTFACGHSINHHKYNNGPLDVISISDMPRDEFKNFVKFLPRYLLYAVNISTIRQFVFQGEYKVAANMFTGTVFYLVWLAIFWQISPLFTLCYLIFPAGENILLLACIQWCWHAFIDPQDPENPYVGSITILSGPINVMGEDYHVVHHQYPGAHWTSHPARYKKHETEYATRRAAAFKGTHAFEMFFLIILRKYREMAERFEDFSGEFDTIEKKEVLIQQRLRACWWGPNAKKSNVTQVGWEGVQKIS